MSDPDLQTCREHGERMAKIEAGLKGLQDQVTQVGHTVEGGFAAMQQTLEKHYVRREEFEPVRSVVYGAVKVVLGLVLVAVVALVIIKG